MSKYLDLLKATFKEWNSDNVPRLAAALAYYTAFSLAPLLLLVLAVVGFFFGDEAARGQVSAQLTSELGPEIAEFVEELLQSANNESQGILSTIISVVMLLVGATGVFAQLQAALNEVWDIKVESGGIWYMLRKRVLSFGMIITLGFLLLVSLLINSAVASLDEFFLGLLPGYQILAHIINFAIAFGITTLLFGIIYKYMPDAVIEWRDVAVGAIVTAILFNLGRFALGLYLGNAGVASSYGAAGSFVAIMTWIYYSAQIVMFGAEFTQVYARRFGSRIVPEEGASFDVGHAKQYGPDTSEPETNSSDKEFQRDETQEWVVASSNKTAIANEDVTEDVALVDRPVVLENAEITYTYKRDPVFTIIVSSVAAFISATVTWFIDRQTKKS